VVAISLLQVLQRLYLSEMGSVAHSVSGNLSIFGLAGVLLARDSRQIRVEALRLLACGTAALCRHSGNAVLSLEALPRRSSNLSARAAAKHVSTARRLADDAATLIDFPLVLAALTNFPFGAAEAVTLLELATASPSVPESMSFDAATALPLAHTELLALMGSLLMANRASASLVEQTALATMILHNVAGLIRDSAGNRVAILHTPDWPRAILLFLMATGPPQPGESALSKGPSPSAEQRQRLADLVAGLLTSLLLEAVRTSAGDAHEILESAFAWIWALASKSVSSDGAGSGPQSRTLLIYSSFDSLELSVRVLSSLMAALDRPTVQPVLTVLSIVGLVLDVLLTHCPPKLWASRKELRIAELYHQAVALLGTPNSMLGLQQHYKDLLAVAPLSAHCSIEHRIKQAQEGHAKGAVSLEVDVLVQQVVRLCSLYAGDRKDTAVAICDIVSLLVEVEERWVTTRRVAAPDTVQSHRLDRAAWFLLCLQRWLPSIKAALGDENCTRQFMLVCSHLRAKMMDVFNQFEAAAPAQTPYDSWSVHWMQAMQAAVRPAPDDFLEWDLAMRAEPLEPLIAAYVAADSHLSEAKDARRLELQARMVRSHDAAEGRRHADKSRAVREHESTQTKVQGLERARVASAARSATHRWNQTHAALRRAIDTLRYSRGVHGFGGTHAPHSETEMRWQLDPSESRSRMRPKLRLNPQPKSYPSANSKAEKQYPRTSTSGKPVLSLPRANTEVLIMQVRNRRQKSVLANTWGGAVAALSAGWVRADDARAVAQGGLGFTGACISSALAS
jgi:hypothetical protein